ncbi:MAG: hypothetical protein AB7G75_30040 [Candidatus Binatia bacterium]
MPLTNYALNQIISHKRSELNEARAKSIAPELTDFQHWFANFPLNAMFGRRTRLNPITWLFVRRAHDCLEDYEEACKLLEQAATDRGSISYFRTLRRFENCLGFVYQSLTLLVTLDHPKLFKRGDGSVYERINRIYNTGRHYDPRKLPNGYLHALWLENEGIYGIDESGETSVSFEELREQVLELGQFAKSIVDGTIFVDSQNSEAMPPGQDKL